MNPDLYTLLLLSLVFAALGLAMPVSDTPPSEAQNAVPPDRNRP